MLPSKPTVCLCCSNLQADSPDSSPSPAPDGARGISAEFRRDFALFLAWSNDLLAAVKVPVDAIRESAAGD